MFVHRHCGPGELRMRGRFVRRIEETVAPGRVAIVPKVRQAARVVVLYMHGKISGHMPYSGGAA